MKPASPELIDRLNRDLATLEATEESDDGRILATTGARGELLTLRLDPRIFRDQDARALSDDIVRTVQAAAATAASRAFDLAAPLLPRGATQENTDLTFDLVLAEIDRMVR
ncbi:YbaB/EbfC family nucleoid-associated protein [Amycolatopsis sp. H20-H5]|uniref:YbaB/EbfC family nucleoid-associated protein n=1 Tax=Amycolatopsis sp. H20-H5 TaxID=3046309 RepID=UPI002DBC56B4|nr:YbaB/EbfC family nucleoid-associated protein [Amycolatopsis sp. H20-H5]MEC3982639.1 YbaB/EbfC family nucleoid-associated protein [Amycolatopsis sp. H20-H5]